MDTTDRGITLIQSGAQLEEFCRLHKYSNSSLATELDISRATLFNWKKDGRALPRIVSLALHALQIEPSLQKMVKKDEIVPRKDYRRKSYTSKASKGGRN